MYEYDSKTNRDLAKTALGIYMKSHNLVEEPKELKEETKQELNQTVNALIVEFVSNVVIQAENEAGTEFSEKEIEVLSENLLNNIAALSNDEKVDFITELAQNFEARLLNESE